MRAFVLLLALAACGQNAEAPAPQPAINSGLDLSGHIIAIGDGFRFDAIPDQDTILLAFPEYDQTVSAAYVAPQATDTGATLISGDITLTLTPGACSYFGMDYPMHAVVSITNGRPAEGCAMIRWDHRLLELMPAIDACVAASPETRWVTYAGERGEGRVIVRMEGEAGPVDCTVANGAASVSPRRDDLNIASENEAIFVRGPGENPGGECYDAPEVRSASGELLGWMADPQGC